jgi:hypothetical protein
VDDRLPDETWVVRGGVMESQTMMTNAQVHNAECPGEWALSVAAVNGWTVEALAMAAPFPNRQMRVSTVGAIRALGHDVRPTIDDPPHADLVLSREPDEELWEELRGAFDPPIPNPRFAEQEG